MDFTLNVVVNDPPDCVSVDIQGSQRVTNLLQQLNLDYKNKKYRVFKAEPGLRYPADHDIANFIEDFVQAGADELQKPDRIDECFDTTIFHSKDVQIVVLHQNGNSTSHFLSLMLQPSH
jgi:hypothetical protein